MSNTIIITGAGGNLGQATVQKFLAEGFDVTATLSPGKSLGYEAKGNLTTHEVDLSDKASVSTFLDSFTSVNKPVDAAALLVGGFAGGKLTNTDVEAIRTMIKLNFETAYNLAVPLADKMKLQKRGGRIILIGSRPAIKATDGKNAIAYSLSKGLIFQLAELLNATYSSQQVVTHVVVPSTLDTPQNRKAMPDANFSDWVKPESIADTIHFLCSESGAVIRESVVKVYGNS